MPVNALLPLLGWNLPRAGVRVDAPLQTHLRAARLTEELRWRKYQEICATAFRTLDAGGVPFIALKGAVIGERVYPMALFRHADDIDLLLHERDIERARLALIDAGWQPGAPPILPSPLHAPPLMHPADVPIELHRRLVIPYYTLPYERLWARSTRMRVAGVDVRVLAEADALLHACAHGMGGWRELKWVVDAWFILAASAAFDWDLLLATVNEARLSLLMHPALEYLARAIGADVPESVLERLAAAASETSRVGRIVARPWPAARMPDIAWWQKAPRLWQRAFPAPVQFASHYDVAMWTVPFLYAYRLAKHLQNEARGRP